MRKLTQEEYLERSKKVHNNFYTYPRLVYKKSTDYVIITCPEHGDFKQEANSHLQGKGCQECYGNSNPHYS